MRGGEPNKVFVRFGAEDDPEMVRSTDELLASNDSLELCQAVAYMEDQAVRMKVRVQHITGMQYDEFIDGMRRLLAPATNDTEAST